MKKLGWAALACYAVHAGFHILNGRPEEALWMCHLGAALVGIGLLCASPTINGIGTLFLAWARRSGLSTSSAAENFTRPRLSTCGRTWRLGCTECVDWVFLRVRGGNRFYRSRH